jgi:hypothetical protein
MLAIQYTVKFKCNSTRLILKVLFIIIINFLSYFSDLYTYPVQCWTSTDMNDDHGQSPITDQQSLSLNTNRSYFINGGCPNLDANNRGMATLTQSTDNRRRRTRFSFTITDAFIPKNAIKYDKINVTISLCRLEYVNIITIMII